MLFFLSGMAFAAILAVAQDIPGVRSGQAEILQQGRRSILELVSPKGPVQSIALTHRYPSGRQTNFPADAQLIAESPHHFLIFTDSFDSNPGNPQGMCGAIGAPGERFVHVVALGARPHETLSVLIESCLEPLLTTPTIPEWLAKPDGAGFAGQLTLRFEEDTQPTAIYSVAPDGSVRAVSARPDPKSASIFPSCLNGIWEEQYQNPASWSFVVDGDSLRLQRNDGFVSGVFAKVGDQYTGDLHWGNGEVWKNVVLIPNPDCSEVRTNQTWWYHRAR
jgi:hypothetical protein